jgi:hypothetical protein
MSQVQSLPRNQYLQELRATHVDQLGINVAVAVFGPDGKNLVEADINGMWESEKVSLIAETPMSYRLEVRVSEKNAPKGRYEVKVEEQRAATERDKSRVAAERLVAEAMLLLYKQTAESLRKAVEKFSVSTN